MGDGPRAIFTAGAALVAPGEAREAWSVLQAIGVAGLITLALIRTDTLGRLWAGLARWGAMLLISTVLADLFHRAQRGTFVYAAASAAPPFSHSSRKPLTSLRPLLAYPVKDYEKKTSPSGQGM